MVQMIEVLRNTLGSRWTSKCETHSKRVPNGDWGLLEFAISLSILLTGDGATLDSIAVWLLIEDEVTVIEGGGNRWVRSWLSEKEQRQEREG
jgi:hypothetical protein